MAEVLMPEEKMPDYERGLTFEKVWAMSQETARRFKETGEQFKETARRFKETDEQFKETDRKIEKFFKGLEKTEKIVARNAKQLGGLHNSFGKMAEHLVAPGIAMRFNELGFQFEAISPGGIKILDNQKKAKTEIDLLLENGNAIIAIEVKAKVAQKDIEHHIKRLEILKEYRSKKNDTRKIYGAIAGAIFGITEKKAALEAGLFVLEQSGDTMKLDLPEDFVPREWICGDS